MASTHNIQRGVNIFVYSMKAKNVPKAKATISPFRLY